MEIPFYVGGIDVHKKMLAVAVANARDTELAFECRRFGTTASELHHLSAWLQERGVQEVVMESTAQYWKPVWIALEGQCRLHLAQARSNRGPRGRKTDIRDAKRSVSRLLSGDLILSYVPEAEQRSWRTLTRTKYQLTRDRVRLQSQLESLLEECQIKLSSVVSDLLGASGRRILKAIGDGETDPVRLKALGDKRLHATDAELIDALTGQIQYPHRALLQLYLQRLDLIEEHMTKLEGLIAEAMKAHQDAVLRLAELPGLGIDSAQQIIAEIGPYAKAFPSAAQLASWVGVCPGRQESAGQSSSNRSAKGNRSMRRLLNQLAHAAVKKQNTNMQVVFNRLCPRLGYAKAVWAIAHRLCRLIWKVLHDGIRYVETGPAVEAITLKRRRQRLVTQLKKLGYDVQLIPVTPASSAS
jgi:transposase